MSGSSHGLLSCSALGLAFEFVTRESDASGGGSSRPVVPSLLCPWCPVPVRRWKWGRDAPVSELRDSSNYISDLSIY